MEEHEIDLRDYLKVIWKRKKMIMLIFFATVIITAIVSLLLPKIYEATLTVITNKPKYQIALDSKSTQTQVLSAEPPAAKFDYLIRDRKLIEKVIKKLTALDPSYANMDPKIMKDMIRIKDVPRTEFIEIIVTADSRKKAADIVETWGKLFIETNENASLQGNQETREYIIEQRNITEENLNKLETQLSDFNEKNTIDLLKEKIKDKTSQIAQYEKSKVDIGLSIATKEAELKQINEELKHMDVKTILSKSLTDDQELQQIAKNITKKESEELKNLRFDSETMNSTYLSLIEDKVKANVALSSWKENLSYIENNIGQLTKELMELKKILAKQELTQNIISRQIGVIRQTYSTLSQKAEEAKITTATNPGLMKIVRETYAPEDAIGPHKRKNVMIAGIISLTFGIFLAFLVEYFGPNKD